MITIIGTDFCAMCGATSHDFWETRPSRRIVLQIKPRWGDSNAAWTICDECHAGTQAYGRRASSSLKAADDTPEPDRLQLLSQIRRATIDDQKAVLEWLVRKFKLRTVAEE